MSKLLVIRHGESQWNLENRFTGWVDVDLSSKGIEEAKQAAKIIQSSSIEFHHSYTSILKRAIKTHYHILNEMDRLWLPVTRTWQLNERHYGALQGLNKEETALKYGDEQVKLWRRSYDTPPPALTQDSPMNPANELRYQLLSQMNSLNTNSDNPHQKNPTLNEWPLFESLKLTIDRVLPLWQTEIVPRLQAGQNILIVAHGNSLRGLIKTIKNLSNEEILELNIPTGKPWVFEFETSTQAGLQKNINKSDHKNIDQDDQKNLAQHKINLTLQSDGYLT